MTEQTASPRPWEFTGNEECVKIQMVFPMEQSTGNPIAFVKTGFADADLIVRAVNSYDRMRKALLDAISLIEESGIEEGRDTSYTDRIETIRAALED